MRRAIDALLIWTMRTKKKKCIKKTRIKVAFAITSFGDVPFASYINHVHVMCVWSKTYDMILVPDHGNTLVQAREHCVDEAIRVGAEYILYVDSDVILPLNTLDSLISCDADLASGLCVRRGYPYSDVAWIKIQNEIKQPLFDPDEPGVHLVEWVGGGCALFKVSAFANLKKPYFQHVYEKGRQLYEDVYLCMKMQKKKMSIMIDSRVQCGHVCRSQVVYPKNAPAFRAMHELITDKKV